jgi:hypothetical protein
MIRQFPWGGLEVFDAWELRAHRNYGGTPTCNYVSHSYDDENQTQFVERVIRVEEARHEHFRTLVAAVGIASGERPADV